MSNEAYVALALGILNSDDASEALEFSLQEKSKILCKSSQEPLLDEITTKFQILEEEIADLAHQKNISLSDLSKLAVFTKPLGQHDMKIAMAAFTSLIAKQLALMENSENFTIQHLEQSKEIVSSIKAYLEQGALIEGLIAMITVLAKNLQEFQEAENYGNEVRIQKLAGKDPLVAFDEVGLQKIRQYIIVAQRTVDRAEEDTKDTVEEAQLLIWIKNKLLKQNASNELAEAVAIVYSASYFSLSSNELPDKAELKNAFECLRRCTAALQHQANQAATVKCLQSFLIEETSLLDSIANAETLRQAVIEGRGVKELEFEGSLARDCWTAFMAIQDYGAITYFSAEQVAFKIERSKAGNGFYHSVLIGMQQALKEDVHNPIHTLTPEALSSKTRELLPAASQFITDTFRAIIHEEGDILCLPAIFAAEVSILQKRWRDLKKMTVDLQRSVEDEITIFLQSIAERYIVYANRHAESGSDIELGILANHHNIQFQKHSHLTDNYGQINKAMPKTAHLFYAVYQNQYHALIRQFDLTVDCCVETPEDFIRRAANAAPNVCVAESIIGTAIGILACQNRTVWRPSKLDNHAIDRDMTLAFALCQEIIRRDTTEQGRLMLQEFESRSSAALCQRNINLFDYFSSISEQKLRANRKFTLEAYDRNWRDQIKEQRDVVEKAFNEFNGKVKHCIDELTKAYQKQLVAIDDHYKNAINQYAAAYNAYQSQLEEARQRARRKKRRRKWRAAVGMVIGFIASPIASQFMFAAYGPVSVAIGEGAIFGLISSATSRRNPLTGMVEGALFAGFGQAVGRVLGNFFEEMTIFREALQAASMASLSTALHGGKLENILLSVGANVLGNLAVPTVQIKPGMILSQGQMMQQTRDAMLRTAITGSAIAVVTGSANLTENVITGLLGVAAQSIGSSQKNNIAIRQAIDTQQRQHFMTQQSRAALRPEQEMPRHDTLIRGRSNGSAAASAAPIFDEQPRRMQRPSAIAQSRVPSRSVTKNSPRNGGIRHEKATRNGAGREDLSGINHDGFYSKPAGLGTNARPANITRRWQELRREDVEFKPVARTRQSNSASQSSPQSDRRMPAGNKPLLFSNGAEVAWENRISGTKLSERLARTEVLHSDPNRRTVSFGSQKSFGGQIADFFIRPAAAAEWDMPTVQAQQEFFTFKPNNYLILNNSVGIPGSYIAPRNIQRGNFGEWSLSSSSDFDFSQACASSRVRESVLPSSNVNIHSSRINSGTAGFKTQMHSFDGRMAIVESLDFRLDRRLPCKTSSAEEQKYLNRMLYEGLVQGVIKLPDIIYDMGEYCSGVRSYQNHRLPLYQVQRPSEMIMGFLDGYGVNLNQAPPRNGFEKLLFAGFKETGGLLAGLGVMKLASFERQAVQFGKNLFQRLSTPVAETCFAGAEGFSQIAASRLGQVTKAFAAEGLGLRVGGMESPSIVRGWESFRIRERVVNLKSNEILFSQSSVKDVSMIVKNMENKGWIGSHIDVVRLPSGQIVSLDNTRLLSASRAGIDVKAVIHNYDELLFSNHLRQRFSTKLNGTPYTWGEALQFRINKQSKSYTKLNPKGSFVTGTME